MKMLKNKRVVDLHWKILYRTGPGVVNLYHKLLKYKIGNRLDCEILEISRCRRRLRLRPHRPLPSLPTSLQGSEEAEGGSVLLLRLQGHGGSLEMHQKVCHLPTYVFIAISSNIQPLNAQCSYSSMTLMVYVAECQNSLIWFLTLIINMAAHIKPIVANSGNC